MSARRPHAPPARCPRESEAVAWLQGELPAAEAEAFARHRDGCDACRTLSDDGAPLLADLARLLEAEAEHGAGPAARPGAAARDSARRRVLLLRGGLAAAGLALVGLLLRDALLPPGAVAPPPAAFVHASLRADGSWDAPVRRAPGPDAVGLHGLGLLALSATARSAPGGRDNLLAAAAWLLEQQHDDGLLGRPPEEGAFDHPVATLALLTAWEHSGRDAFGHAARRAVERLQAQGSSHAGTAPAAWRTPAQALWELAALLRAQELGLAVSPAHLARRRQAVARELGPGAAALDARATEALALARRPALAERSLGPLFGAAVAVLAHVAPGAAAGD